MQGIYRKPAAIFTAKAATGIGNTIPVHELGNVIFQLGGALNSSLTVKFQGSVSDAAPDFSAAQSPTNHWDYIDVIDLQNDTSIDGDTGVALNNATEAANTNMYRIASPFMRWVNCEVTSYTDGDATVSVGGRE